MTDGKIKSELKEKEKELCRKLMEFKALWKAVSVMNISYSWGRDKMKLFHRLSGTETFPDLLFWLSVHPEFYS